VNNTTNTGETSVVLRIAERLLEVSHDATVSDLEISVAAGEDITRKPYVVQQALDKLNREHGAVFKRERGVGWRRLPPGVGVAYAGQQGLKRTRRASRRGRVRTSNALHHANDLSAEERRKAHQTITTLGLTEYLAQDRVVRTMPEERSEQPDIAKALKDVLGL
jgi:hypothetical protein